MKDLVKFEFQGKGIRTVVIDGNPYWVAKDIAEVLGYKDTVNAVKQHCRGVVKRHPIVDALGRTQEAHVIGEPDLYRLIAHSNLPAAVEFEKWIFEEVLPQIRKTGKYEARPQAPTLPTLPGESLRPYIEWRLSLALRETKLFFARTKLFVSCTVFPL